MHKQGWSFTVRLVATLTLIFSALIRLIHKKGWFFSVRLWTTLTILI